MDPQADIKHSIEHGQPPLNPKSNPGGLSELGQESPLNTQEASSRHEASEQIREDIQTTLASSKEGQALIAKEGLAKATQDAEKAIAEKLSANPLLPEGQAEKQALKEFVEALHADGPAKSIPAGTHWSELNKDLNNEASSGDETLI